MPSDFLNRIAEGPLLCDGGYYLEFERRCLGSYASKIPMGVLDFPEGVLELHKEFARAGAEVLQAMVWGVRPMEREEELHSKAVELAREAAGQDRFVAGTLSPFVYSGRSKWEPMTEEDRTNASEFFERRVTQQTSAGVDLFIVETFYSVDEISLAIPFVKQAGIPAVVTMTYRDAEFTREGYRPGEAAKRLVDVGADVVGINCMRPWSTMRPLMYEVREAVSVPLCAQPTGYELEPGENFNRPLSVANLWTQVEPRVVTRFSMAEYTTEAAHMGIGLIGSCCGALPFHVRAMAEALGKATDLPDVNRGYHGLAG
ncbi:MAG: homocysteine S-methyltransferase family protein [Gemmatimonadota bacterium]|nr:homocysteine S-methyltransferase family protein [Gemmatimonadota bacterium]